MKHPPSKPRDGSDQEQRGEGAARARGTSRDPISSPPVGVLVRERREALGMTLQQLADKSGCAKSYVSAVENGKRDAPSDEVLARMERALRIPAGTLREPARWRRSIDAGGETVERGVGQMRSDQAAGRRLAELLTRHGGEGSLDRAFRSGELRRLVDALAPAEDGNARRVDAPSPVPLPLEVPLINSVAAGYPREFTDLGYPARVADQYVRCPDLHDPDMFAACVVGDSMEPAYCEGDIVIFSPAKPLASGMDCFARIEPDHESTFKRVYFEKDAQGQERIRLQPLNNKYPPRTLQRELVAGLYAAVKVIRDIGGG